MANFTATGEPRFQSAPPPTREDVKGQPAIDTHAGFRQFEWLAQVTQTASGPDAFEVGLIQNMLACTVNLLYTSGPDDSTPAKVKFEVSPVPILDSKVVGKVWLGGNFNVLGTNTVSPNEILPPGISRTSVISSAAVNGGDDPGGRFPIRHPQQTSRLLRNIQEQLDFVTWVAVLKKGSPSNLVASYEFVKNVSWVVRRKTILAYSQAGNFAATFTENSTRMNGSPGVGMGAKTPLLGGSIANQAGKFTGMVLP